MNPDSTAPATAPAPVVTEDRTVAIISYITLIGFIIALVMFGQPGKKTALNGFHLRQNLGLFVVSFALYLALMILAFIPVIQLISVIGFPVLGLGSFVLWIMGLISAVNGELKPVPVVGAKIQEIFKGAFV